MKHFNKLFTSAFCLVSLTAGMAKADNTSGTGGWSEWKHDDRVLPELYLRSRCTRDPADPKKAIWEIQFKDIGDALVEVKGKDFKYDIPAHDKSAGAAQVATKSCSKMPEVKMDGGVPAKGYGYKLTFKDGTLTVKPHDHHKVDWGGWLTAGMMGAAAATGTMAENDSKMAEIRAQQQAQQQAAAQARAQQLAQLQAAQQLAQAAAAQKAPSGAASTSPVGSLSSGDNPGSSSARGSGNTSKFVTPVSQCAKQVFDMNGETQFAQEVLYVVNVCNIEISVKFTSSGDIWGGMPLAPGARSSIASADGVRQVGGVNVFACTGYGWPWLPDGSEPIPNHYKGLYTCSPGN